MHFNTESNYYIIMGLPQNASSGEIRERWKKLMLLYHPDRQGGDDSWVSERAKKVNEAYSILKDNEKRQAFDQKLFEQAIARKPAARPDAAQRPPRHRSSSHKISKDPEWDRKKKNIPKILVGAYIIAALTFLGYIYLQNNAEHLESALIGKERQAGQPLPKPGAKSGKENSNSMIPLEPPYTHNETDKGSTKSLPLPAVSPVSEGKKAETREVIHKPAPAGIPAAPDTPVYPVRDLSLSRINPAAEQRGIISDVVKGNEASAKQQSGTDKVISSGDSAPKNTMPLLPPAATDTVLGPQTRIQEPAPKLSVPQVKDIPAANYSTRTPEPPRPVIQEAPASAQPVQTQKAPGLTREEVEDFMKQYSSAYSRGDLNTFMSHFSRSVVENNRLSYSEVQEAYRKTFSEKINFYRINNMTIMLNGQSANVSGLYELSRYTSAEDRWVRYSGKIQWKITKENNELKIISMNYDK